MKKRYRIIIFLLVVPPIFGEVLSGSTPLLSFVQPVTCVLLMLLYGCGALVVRELRIRWRLGRGVVFLAIAYGILEEAVIVQTFFNPGWEDLGVLSAYGMYVGIQWPWALMLIAFHGTISILAPLAAADLIRPDDRDEPLLKTPGLVLAIAGIALMAAVAIPGFRRMPEMAQTLPGWGVIAGAGVVVGLLIVAARLSGGASPPSMPGRGARLGVVFGAAFLFQALNVGIPFFCAEQGVDAVVTIILQSALMCLALGFALRTLFSPIVTEGVRWAALSGSLGFWMIVATSHEVSGPGWPNEHTGAGALSLGIVLFLVFLRKRILIREERRSIDGNEATEAL